MPYELKRGVLAPSAVRQCSSCSLFKDCLFDLKQRGGFKGTEEHYIGYRLITDRVEGHGAKEDFCTCHNFIEGGLQKRMSVGRSLREDGKDGEIVRIVAQQGEYIHRSVEVGFNLKGEIVKPQTHLIDAFKEAGYKVSTEPGQVAVEWRTVEYRIQVPNRAEEVAKSKGYRQSVLKRELDEQGSLEAAEDLEWEKLHQQRKAEQAATAPTGARKSA